MGGRKSQSVHDPVALGCSTAKDSVWKLGKCMACTLLERKTFQYVMEKAPK